MFACSTSVIQPFEFVSSVVLEKERTSSSGTIDFLLKIVGAAVSKSYGIETLLRFYYGKYASFKFSSRSWMIHFQNCTLILIFFCSASLGTTRTKLTILHTMWRDGL